jgi:hypothetical protein
MANKEVSRYSSLLLPSAGVFMMYFYILTGLVQKIIIIEYGKPETVERLFKNFVHFRFHTIFVLKYSMIFLKSNGIITHLLQQNLIYERYRRKGRHCG